MSARDAGRLRAVVELSEDVDALLEHVSKVLGVPRAQLVARALLDALPAMVDQADAVRALAGRLRPAPVGVSDTAARTPSPADVLDGFITEMGASNG